MSMRKIVIVAAAIGLFSLTASAETYFEIGFGVGKGWTLLDGEEPFANMPGLSETAVELGFKIGYGPLAGVPLYVTGEFGGMGHQFRNEYSDFIQFNSYIIGPGVIYYPIPRLQAGVTIGYSYTAVVASPATSIGTGNGFGYNASLGYELGNQSNGFLIGVKFLNALNFIEATPKNVAENCSFVGLFMRYTHWWGRF